MTSKQWTEPVEWEYRISYYSFIREEYRGFHNSANGVEDLLNHYGKQGWELVSVVPLCINPEPESTMFGSRIDFTNYIYTFKRPFNSSRESNS